MIFINTASNTTGLFKPFFPITLPYGIGFLMAVLKREGIVFNYVDQQLHPNPLSEIAVMVKNHSAPYVFCISTLTEAFSSAKTLARQLKIQYPGSIVILGGLHPSCMPDEVMLNEEIDYVFSGEAESEIVEIYHRLKAGLPINHVKGIGFRKNGALVLNDPPELIKELDSLPDFPYELFSHSSKYHFGHMISSRGCPFNCSFCCVKAVGKRRYRYKSAANTVSELELLATDYAQREIAFFDDNFLANTDRIHELCAAIRKSPKLKNCSYSFQARSRDLNEDLLKEMYASGFRTVFFGIETVSEKLLREVGKDETLDEIKQAIQASRNTGFKVMANFLYCLPNETRDIRSNCVSFAIDNHIDVAKFNNVVPYPGTRMYDETLGAGRLHVDADFSNFNSQLVLVRPAWQRLPFPYLPEGSTGYGMRNEILFSYFKFYFRFGMIKKMLTKKDWGGAIFSFGSSNWEAFRKFPLTLLLLMDVGFKLGLMFLSIFTPIGISFKACFGVFFRFFKKV